MKRQTLAALIAAAFALAACNDDKQAPAQPANDSAPAAAQTASEAPAASGQQSAEADVPVDLGGMQGSHARTGK